MSSSNNNEKKSVEDIILGGIAVIVVLAIAVPMVGIFLYVIWHTFLSMLGII